MCLFFLSLQSMRQLKILILGTRFCFFPHTKTVLKLPKTEVKNKMKTELGEEGHVKVGKLVLTRAKVGLWIQEHQRRKRN